MRINFLFIIFIFIISRVAFTQSTSDPSYPQDLFISPVSHPIILSGSFAEPRSNHFHAGIDIKPSNGKSGDPILSIADGVITRIMVHPSGYGNSILIDHQNGFSSLYAHLDGFNDQIAAIVKRKQYEQQSFMQRLSAADLNIQVKQGDVIGFLGNTGRSHGAHLHFEIRNTSNDRPLNPMLFGIKPKDTRAPELKAIKIYALDQKDMVKAHAYHQLSRQNQIDTIIVHSKKFQLSVEMLDRMNGAPNKNGVYKLDAFENGRLKYAYQMDQLDFNHGRHINAHIDYFEKEENSKNFSYCHHEPMNQLPIYSYSASQPYFEIKNAHTEIKLRAEDFHGNQSEVTVIVKYDPTHVMDETKKLFNYGIISGTPQLIERENFILYFPKNSLKHDEFFFIENQFDSLGDHSIRIESKGTPLFEPMNLLLKKTARDSTYDQYHILKKSKDKWTNLGGTEKDSFMYITTSSLGEFVLSKDTIAPTIKSVNFKKNMSGQKSVSFEIKDNLEPSGSSTYLQYNGYIDDQWVLFEYDLKKDKITHQFDAALKGKHALKIVLIDPAGNQTIYSRSFVR